MFVLWVETHTSIGKSPTEMNWEFFGEYKFENCQSTFVSQIKNTGKLNKCTWNIQVLAKKEKKMQELKRLKRGVTVLIETKKREKTK